ncbi:MAG: LON peptidase substrate-binding domain-containing protein [Capsulimonadaceae bacterium]
MINYDNLPLFPLHTVLFPAMPLPLHIFEPRYVEMIEHCLAADTSFGVVLIRAGAETAPGRCAGSTDGVGCGARSFSVGTTARVTHSEILSNGRRNIVATGETRIRIRETFERRSYMTACVEPLLDVESEPVSLSVTHADATELFKTYLRVLYSLANRHVSCLQVPTDASALSYAVAAALHIPVAEKQRLLEIPSADARLRREIEILRREIDSHQCLRPLHFHRPGERAPEICPINGDVLRRQLSRN